MSFAESKSGRVAFTTLLNKAKVGIEGKAGTRMMLYDQMQKCVRAQR